MTFPTNIVEELESSFKKQFDDEYAVMTRPLRYTDPARSIGVYVSTWMPTRESHEIGMNEPTLSTYFLRIQNMIQAAEEQQGRAMFSVDAKIVRVMLYRDPDLRVALASLAEESFGSEERLKRYGVSTQAFLNNELQGQFVFLATTDLWVETETTRLPS